MNKRTRAIDEDTYKLIIATMKNGFAHEGVQYKPNERIATVLVLEYNLGLRVGDASYYLTVNTSGKSVELGEIHIDNIAPECNVPSYYHDGGWMMGVNPEPIKITDINEKIDTKLTKVYVDGKEVEYKYDSKEKTLSFNVGKGNHSVGISLVDTAGNAYDIPEIRNFYVGNTRLYVGMGIAFIGAVSLLTFIRAKKRKGKRENK